ncbi:hypothetical protein FQN60_017311 [Etheostoma spectabile]|uniref:Dynactin subunit 3 n=1 Tax=Etheostoma spectabile TaxID=54343 RepID=A0A5J5DF62_9PERO|nr:hypothetical protein FQN60_017311 [Etheostoma spectabile]
MPRVRGRDADMRETLTFCRCFAVGLNGGRAVTVDDVVIPLAVTGKQLKTPFPAKQRPLADSCLYCTNDQPSRMDNILEVDNLEMRLRELESRIYGERRNKSGKPVKCAESLARIQAGLTNTANKRERVKILHKKKEDFLLSQAALLEQISNTQPLLDSTYIRDVPEHATKLQRLSQIHIKEQDQTEAQSLEVKKLFEEYNKMMFLLSKQFTQWDETLRKLEEAKGIRPVE